MNIEVEIRSFLSQEEYDRLLQFFKTHAEFLSEEDQETWYFKGDHDFRIQKGNVGAKFWMKKGKVHDEQREELEIPFAKDDFEKAAKLLGNLGFEQGVKWFRKRITFLWDGITVCLDNTRGYGMILELEKMSDKEHKEEILALLKTKIADLGITVTPREEFEKKYQYYKENWERLTDKKDANL